MEVRWSDDRKQVVLSTLSVELLSRDGFDFECIAELRFDIEVVKKTLWCSNGFSTTTYAASPYFGTLIWKAAQSGEMIKQLQKI